METAVYYHGQRRAGKARYKPIERETPLAFLHPPLPEQMRDADRLSSHLRMGDFSDPGTGKTLTALVAWKLAQALFRNDPPPLRVLLVVPPIALQHWVSHCAAALHEYIRVDPNRKIQLIGSSKDKIHDDVLVVITTYGMLSLQASEIEGELLTWSPDIVILDESDNACSPTANVTQRLYRPDGLVDTAMYFWPLTGTPQRRHADDLFVPMNAINPEAMQALRIGSPALFRAKFCRTRKVRYGRMRQPREVVSGSQNMELLKTILFDGFSDGNIELEPLAVRRTLNDIAPQLPPLSFREVDTVFTPSGTLVSLCDAIDEEEIAEGEGDVLSPKRSSALRELGRLKAPAVAAHVASVVRDNERLGRGGVLVLFWHTVVGEALENALWECGFPAMLIDGSTPQKDRLAAEQAFNEGKCRILLGQIKSMGVALNLQAGGSSAVFAEMDWSDARMQQAYQRLYRMGQTQHVQVDWCLTDHWLEQGKVRSAAAKRMNADILMGGMRHETT